MRVDTPFLIASVTKMYTAAAVMILQSRGKLRLDERISKYIPSSVIQGFLYYDKAQNLYMAGTINQMTLRNTPFQLMIKAAQLFRKAEI